jgi:hypothetical protein
MRACTMPRCSAVHPVMLVKHSESFAKELEIVKLQRENEALRDLVLEAIKLAECYDELRMILKEPSQWGSSFKQRSLQIIAGTKKDG